MASKLIRCTIALLLVLAGCFAAAASPARASALGEAAPEKPHHFKFYLDPALLTDGAFAQAVLPKYVADMNAILAKNTVRRLVFDPAVDIVEAPAKPQTDSAASPLPLDGFEIWAYATPSTASVSYGGFATVDASGAGVLAGLHWTRIYDPDSLAPAQVLDYTIQINNMLHELAHVFGAGIGEYYSLARILDTTGVEPLLDISTTNSADPYWSDKPDFQPDPLLRLAHAATRADYIAYVRFSDLTAAVLNGDFRNGIPSFDRYTLQVLDAAGQPVPGAQVKVWSVVAKSPYAAQLLYDGLADEHGEITLDWGGVGAPHNVNNLLRLVKAYKDGLPVAAPHYVSIFDADIARLVRGQSSLALVMRPPNHPPSDLTLSSAAVDENRPVGTGIGVLTAVDPDAGDVLAFSFCGGADDASFQLQGPDLLSSVVFDYESRDRYTICVEVQDGRGGAFRSSFDIQVNDIADTSTASFRSMASNDGWVLESAAGTNKGGALNSAGTAFNLGSDASGRRYRAVLSFNTASLPDNAVLTGVTLKVRKQGLTGTDPFASLGSLVLDVSKPFIGSVAGLQSADFQARVGLGSAGAFVAKPDASGWYSAVLKPSALGFVNLQGPTQFRLRFSGTGGSGARFLTFYSGNAAAADRPLLRVEYQVP